MNMKELFTEPFSGVRGNANCLPQTIKGGRIVGASESMYVCVCVGIRVKFIDVDEAALAVVVPCGVCLHSCVYIYINIVLHLSRSRKNNVLRATHSLCD